MGCLSLHSFVPFPALSPSLALSSIYADDLARARSFVWVSEVPPALLQDITESANDVQKTQRKQVCVCVQRTRENVCGWFFVVCYELCVMCAFVCVCVCVCVCDIESVSVLLLHVCLLVCEFARLRIRPSRTSSHTLSRIIAERGGFASRICYPSFCTRVVLLTLPNTRIRFDTALMDR